MPTRRRGSRLGPLALATVYGLGLQLLLGLEFIHSAPTFNEILEAFPPAGASACRPNS
jgi:hypothetical protein